MIRDGWGYKWGRHTQRPIKGLMNPLAAEFTTYDEI